MYNLSEHTGYTGALGFTKLAGLTGAATTHSHLANLPYAVNGVSAELAAGTTTPVVNSSPTDVGAVTPRLAAGVALSVTAPAAGFRAALVVWTIDLAGTKRIRSRGFFESAGGSPIDLQFPEIPATEAPIAYHTVKGGTTVSGTWSYGVGNWNATGITIGTVVNLVGQPLAGTVSAS